MKDENKKHIPPIKKQGWSANEIIEQGANEESDDVVEKLIHGDEDKVQAEREKPKSPIFPESLKERSDRDSRKRNNPEKKNQ